MIRAYPLVLLLVTLQLACDKSDNNAGEKKPQPNAQAATSTQTPAVWPATTQPGRMGVGDLLGIELTELSGPGVSTVFPKQIGEDGTISLPVISKPISVAGQSKADIEKAIAQIYRTENVIQNAQVSVRRLRVAGTGGPAAGPLAPFDLVRVGIGELSGPASMTVLVMRISGEGIVSVPLVGSQKIGGMTDQQVEGALIAAYRDANIIAHPLVSVVRLESAPAGADKIALPDTAINPVPEMLRWLYEPRTGK